ncbi:hypothetical protein BASA83_013749 [Batrachochytrium salamandrivorans]|nr:hypothetical protein BASA83_013749 [Batrachochytrium salamandrivorans]
MRIERFVETNNLLFYEQAGFRKREECVGQVVSLVDIIQRRQNAGLNTHVLFIDIRKAFDTVPVGALLWKLQNMGFPSSYSCLFSRHCTHPHLLELGQDHYYRTHSQYREVSDRDVHCLDFCSIYSSTTFSMVSPPITVPGLPRDTNPIRGLMYADDWSWAKPTYGLELVGGNKSHLAPLQTTINKGIRLFTGARLSTAIGPLLVETGIGSLLTRSLVSRVRLLERSVTKKTPINAICFQLIPLASLCDSTATQHIHCHLVVECEQVTGHRSVWTSTSNSEITTQIAGSRTRSGVENVYTWLRGGVLNGEADLDQLVGRDCGAIYGNEA